MQMKAGTFNHSSTAKQVLSSDQVHVRVQDIFPIIQQAIAGNRAFLADFAQDTIRLPKDLYEVLIAFQRFQGEKAA